MILQCQLGRAICKLPGVAGGLLSLDQAETKQQEVEKWLDSFPPTYRVADPDMQWDEDYQVRGFTALPATCCWLYDDACPSERISHKGSGPTLS